jgi:hypothetical protein
VDCRGPFSKSAFGNSSLSGYKMNKACDRLWLRSGHKQCQWASGPCQLTTVDKCPRNLHPCIHTVSCYCWPQFAMHPVSSYSILNLSQATYSGIMCGPLSHSRWQYVLFLAQGHPPSVLLLHTPVVGVWTSKLALELARPRKLDARLSRWWVSSSSHDWPVMWCVLTSWLNLSIVSPILSLCHCC